MSARKWRSRWGDHDLEATHRRLAEASRRMNLGPLPESVFGRTEAGMLDYRGAILEEPVRYLRIHQADFSNASFKQGASINESELVNCILDRVDMRGVFVRRSFEKCSFIEAKLSKCRLGTAFNSCDFSGADLAGSVATGCRFERCIFSGANVAELTSALPASSKSGCACSLGTVFGLCVAQDRPLTWTSPLQHRLDPLHGGLQPVHPAGFAQPHEHPVQQVLQRGAVEQRFDVGAVVVGGDQQ
jgi:fluoroquinolone resistance protein